MALVSIAGLVVLRLGGFVGDGRFGLRVCLSSKVKCEADLLLGDGEVLDGVASELSCGVASELSCCWVMSLLVTTFNAGVLTALAL